MTKKLFITRDELRAAGALDVPPAWRKSLGGVERKAVRGLFDHEDEPAADDQQPASEADDDESSADSDESSADGDESSADGEESSADGE